MQIRLWARKALLWMLVGLVGLGGCTRSSETGGLLERATGDSVLVEVNSKAPAFATRTLDGDTVRLADYVGSHVVLIEFWSIFCKSCIEEMPHIEVLYQAHAAEGLVVLSVNTDVFSAAKISSFMDKAGIRPPYPILRDQRQEVAGAFGVELLPVTVIVDREGWIRLYQEGYRPGDEKIFERTVRRLLGAGSGDDVTLAPRDGVTTFAPPGSALVSVGEVCGQRAARSMDGMEVVIGGGKPQMLYFWSLYCTPCRSEFPAVVKLAEKYGPLGLGVAAVNVDSASLSARVARFVATHNGLPCLMDSAAGESDSWSRALGVRATPSLVLVDGKGTVIYSAAGHVDISTVDGAIRTLVGEAGNAAL